MDIGSLFPSYSKGKINGDSIPGLSGNTSSATNRSVNVINGPTGDSFIGMILSSALGGPSENGGLDLPWAGNAPKTQLVAGNGPGSSMIGIALIGALVIAYVLLKKG